MPYFWHRYSAGSVFRKMVPPVPSVMAEELHGHAVMVHQHPQGAAPYLIEGRVGQRAAFLRLDVRGLGDFLQIVPEHPPPQPHGHGRKRRAVTSRAERSTARIHRLRQSGGQAEEVVPVPPLGGG